MKNEKQKAERLVKQILEDGKNVEVSSRPIADVSANEKRVLYDSIDKKIGPMSTPVACG